MATQHAPLPDLTRTDARPATDGDGVRRQLGLSDPRGQPFEFEFSPQDRHVANMTAVALEANRRRANQRASMQDAADELAHLARRNGLL